MKFTNEELTPPKFRTAINNACKECIWDPLSGTGSWRMQVELCTSPKCSLYCVRPLTEDTTKLRAQARRDLTGTHLTPGAFKPGNKIKNQRSS